MEAVRAFNNELSSLYESKPPVSRAKMAQVTKCAIKAIKFYKHVVQSVEKFIQKCKPEYKVPGLYVIDSIVRQSRHQFGPEKDVFSPRFTKNIVNTFVHLFKCPVEERSRVVRVLNLWQKNTVFPMEVIQPLLDLAADPNNSELVTAAQRSVDAVVSVTQKVPLPGAHSGSNGGDAGSNQLLQQTEMLSTITKLLQQAQEGSITGTAPESELQQLQHLQQQLVMQTERISKPQESTPPIDSNLLAQIQMLTNQLLHKTGSDSGDTGKLHKAAEPLFNKKLLDFDYGDSEEDDDGQDHHHHHHHQQPQQRLLLQPGPGLLQNSDLLQQIQQMSQQQEQLESEIGAQEQLRRRLLEQQQQQFDREIEQAAIMANQDNYSNQDMDSRQGDGQEQDFSGRRRHRDSKERSRSPRRRPRRSRSRSREKRRRSRSRDRHRRSRSRDRERRDREKERERRKRGLPPLRERYVSICSMTLWFGHLTKHTTEEELREHIEKYGTIKTINMIPPRGCAFVCLTKRKDAFKALDRLKGVKVNGNALKVAWAPGIGVKESMFKDLWDVDLGVTYIPWEQLPSDLVPFVAGGMVDIDSLPEKLKGMKTGEEDEGEEVQHHHHQQQNQTMDGGMIMQPPPQLPLNLGQPPNFPMPGPMGMMGLGPLGMLNAPPPPMNIRPGNMNNIGGIPGLGGPRPGLAGIRPMNMGPQGPMGNEMLGGQAPSPRMDLRSSQMGMNSPRGPYPPFGNMQRWQSPGGMRPPFFNHDQMGDGDMRGMAEPKEWPPDDEVNAEDEPDEDMDSDERIIPPGGRMNRPGMHNLQGLGQPFGPHNQMLPPNQMLGISRAQSPNSGMPSLLSLHMMPPGQQQQVLAVQGGPGGFALAPGGVRLAVGVRPGLVPTSSHMLPPSAGGMPRPNSSPNSDMPNSPQDDMMGSHSAGPVPLMQIQGGNRQPSGPILGRGFAPMTIRPRGGPGLLGLRPGAQGIGGFARFGGPRPLMGPSFHGMERPPFGNRFGGPLRPPIGFLDQDEREDKDERRPPPRIDEQVVPGDVDERHTQDLDERQDIDDRPKPTRASGRPSRWSHAAGETSGSETNSQPSGDVEEEAKDASDNSIPEEKAIPVEIADNCDASDPPTSDNLDVPQVPIADNPDTPVGMPQISPTETSDIPNQTTESLEDTPVITSVGVDPPL
ncbi:SR-related and CTD-associated factor 4-like isoform X2 [Physella acuta]|uniref:SR-related and CTD-associated factor 4-like isoform X2 n=1 Tax=Physella acuta TaxID=109671 RepID=UPI0027DEA2A3|nr:SR-related and CTD-associated factor 4-like isoform X2 [Physella acuta]